MELPSGEGDRTKALPARAVGGDGVGSRVSDFMPFEMQCAFRQVLFTAASQLSHRWALSFMKEMQPLDLSEFSHHRFESGCNIPLKNHLPLFLCVNLEAHSLVLAINLFIVDYIFGHYLCRLFISLSICIKTGPFCF